MRAVTRVLLCAAVLVAAAPASARPVVAILAQNGGTEITDFLVPYGVIASSGAAVVEAVSTEEGPVELVPGPVLSGMKIFADTTLSQFERAHPDGADFVIVPAFLDSENAMTREWLRGQAGKGATLVSICDGSIVVAGTGLCTQVVHLGSRDATLRAPEQALDRGDLLSALERPVGWIGR